MFFLTGSLVISVCMNSMGENPDENTDNASILLKYANGSNAVLNYFQTVIGLFKRKGRGLFSRRLL